MSPYRFLEESAIKDSSDFVDKQFNQKSYLIGHITKNKVKSNGTSIIHLGQYIWDEHKNIDLVTKNLGGKF